MYFFIRFTWIRTANIHVSIIFLYFDEKLKSYYFPKMLKQLFDHHFLQYIFFNILMCFKIYLQYIF